MSESSTGTSERPAGVKPHWWGVFVLPGTFILVAVIFFVTAVVISPPYIGASQTTTGTILSSPNYHPVVSYTVDGREYTVTTKTNMPTWSLGQQIAIRYNPRNPAQASTTSARTSSVIFGWVGLGLVAAGIATGIPAVRRRQDTLWAIAHGERVEARITGVTQTTTHVFPTRNLTRLTCQWTSPDEVTHTFRTLGRTLTGTLTIRDVPIRTLPVYIDPANPDPRYYVDDSYLAVDGVPVSAL